MEGTSLYLPFVILLMQCSPSVPVTVSTKSHKVEVREFSDAELSCMFHTEKDPHPRIEWKKKGKDVSFVYFEGHFKGSFVGRATIEGATVKLRKVTQEDAGEYRCEISAPQDSVSLGETNVTLKVLVPPHTPSCEVPSGAVTGTGVKLRCSDQQSIPPATYSWYKDNQQIRPPRHANATYLINSLTGILEFKAVAKEDTGRYSCLASNGVGPAKMCEGKQMTIEDVNVTAVVAAVVVVCLVVIICGCGGFLLHRNGFFSPGHRGRVRRPQHFSQISNTSLHRQVVGGAAASYRAIQRHLSPESGRSRFESRQTPTSYMRYGKEESGRQDRSNVNYIPPPQEPQDFKHTQSFML